MNVNIKGIEIKKIVYIAELFPTQSETWVCEEIFGLKKANIQVIILSTRQKPKIYASDFETLINETIYLKSLKFSNYFINFRNILNRNFLKQILDVLSSEKFRLRFFFQFIRSIIYFIKFSNLFKSLNPNLIISHFGGSRANLALLFKLRFGVDYAIKFHAGDVFNRVGFLSRKITNCKYPLTISNFNLSWFNQNYMDINTSRFTIHHCGINPIKFNFNKNIENQGTPLILSVGRLVEMKGFNDLIELSEILVKRKFDHKVLIIGDGPLYNNLSKTILNKKLEKIITLSRYLPPLEIYRFLKKATVFVLLCKFDYYLKTMDGIPVALMEAMAVGVPVISTKISGIPELIKNGENGFLVEPNNLNDLYSLIMKVFNSTKESLNVIRTNARNTIEEEFNIIRLTDQLLQILDL